MAQLLMGNEAIALGALRAGVTIVTGYPGTPSTEILETVAARKKEGVYVEWSVNEKVALEVAAGAAYSGARCLVTMKQVGLNVASDPLMSLNYVGVKGGLVIAVADDPGPISSQTEQDTRRFGAHAKVAVFDPSTPEEAYTMMADAFELSERIGRPVILRSTTRVCHSYASVELLDDLPVKEPEGFQKDGGRWVIFPSLTYRNHIEIEKQLTELSEAFSAPIFPYNRLSGSGRKGITAGGVSFAYTEEALADIGAEQKEYKLLKVSTQPFPDELALEFLEDLDEVLVAEELDPVIEDNLVRLCGLHGLRVKIRGKRSGDMSCAGENTVSGIRRALSAFLGMELPQDVPVELPPLPIRPPVLCAGCPHRNAFFAVKEAAKRHYASGRKAVFSGDIGCYTLGNAPPLDMVDTCLCMGAGITVAQGIHRVEPETLNFSFTGDSTFFHTGIPGIVNAVYNATDIIVVILDNYTTAMTGSQPHPGTGKNAMGKPAPKISIHDVVASLGVSDLQRVSVFDYPAAKQAVEKAIAGSGVRVILFEGPCIMVDRGGDSLCVDNGTCTGCGICIRKLGCPALSMKEGKAMIDPVLCTGCGLCTNVCPFGAIARKEANC